jgi:hypothetical protein
VEQISKYSIDHKIQGMFVVVGAKEVMKEKLKGNEHIVLGWGQIY